MSDPTIPQTTTTNNNDHTPSSSPKPQSTTSSSMIPFWIMGLLNNTSYVIMIASAKTISEGGTALVFLASVIPGMTVKLSSPYWFDKVGYGMRIMVCTGLMMVGFGLVGSGGDRGSVGVEFLGVMLCSVQCSLGEASLLALAGKFDSMARDLEDDDDDDEEEEGEQHVPKNKCLTAFSSGTGLAGVFGFAYSIFMSSFLQLSLRVTLYCAVGLAVLYGYAYWFYLGDVADDHLDGTIRMTSSSRRRRDGYDGVDTLELTEEQEEGRGGESVDDGGESSTLMATDEEDGEEADTSVSVTGKNTIDSSSNLLPPNNTTTTATTTSIVRSADYIQTLSVYERWKLTLSLWPYMIPLFTVYAAEYALQSGTWTSIGFPVESKKARDTFYVYSNWLYQAGVFISRSSGTIYTAPLSILWLMPILQCINLLFYTTVASTHLFYNFVPLLYLGCFYTGLLGGGVYVNGYMRINTDLEVWKREFALSTTSVAESFGIVVADVGGLFLQGCLYEKNGLDGAVVKCPF